MFDPNAMDGPADKEWASNVGEIMQQHLAAKDAVNAAQNASDQAATNLASYKAGALNYVSRDPSALPAVLRTVPHTIAAMVAGHPQAEDVGTGLMQHIAGEATRAAVRSAAGAHEGLANALLDQHADLLPEDEVGQLRSYIGNMAAMRMADTQAQARDTIRQTYLGSDAAGAAHLSGLAHPDTGQLMFPAGWGQNMMADSRLLPATKGALLHAYARLQTVGEPTQPDPNVVTDILSRAANTRPNAPGHPSVSSVIRQAGYGLSAADASWLASKVGPQPVEGQAERQALSDTLGNARTMLGNPAAYSRFVQWFLPSYQRATAAGTSFSDVLHPDSKGYVLAPERMQQFMPNGSDALKVAQADPRPITEQLAGPKKGPLPWDTGKAFPGRPSLGQIFGS